jgi:hypothetical protein
METQRYLHTELERTTFPQLAEFTTIPYMQVKTAGTAKSINFSQSSSSAQTTYHLAAL